MTDAPKILRQRFEIELAVDTEQGDIQTFDGAGWIQPNRVVLAYWLSPYDEGLETSAEVYGQVRKKSGELGKAVRSRKYYSFEFRRQDHRVPEWVYLLANRFSPPLQPMPPPAKT